MPPLNSRATRQLVKRLDLREGPKSLHRGLHLDVNAAHVASFNSRSRGSAEALTAAATRQRDEARELLVHHQKVAADLQDIYARTAALHKDDMTLEERVEESWKAFERIGGKRPRAVVGFAKHLSAVSAARRDERQRGAEEKTTSGETTDFRRGSALHDAKDRRVKKFQQRQLKRAHMLRKVGNPEPLRQSGRFDDHSGTLTVFKKTMRKVKREAAHEAKVRAVRGGGRRGKSSMWDLRGTADNINRPTSNIVQYTREFELGSRTRAVKRRR